MSTHNTTKEEKDILKVKSLIKEFNQVKVGRTITEEEFQNAILTFTAINKFIKNSSIPKDKASELLDLTALACERIAKRPFKRKNKRSKVHTIKEVATVVTVGAAIGIGISWLISKITD